MDKNTQLHLIEYLKDFISVERLVRINEILEKRTNQLTIVLEDLHKSHNANAVLRSCEGFGVQDVHIIENNNVFDEAATVSIGAHNWLTLYRYNSPEEDNVAICFDALRAKGYKIFATSPHENDSDIMDIDVNQKTALVFGTELEGVSDRVMEMADGFVKIPMYGFSESFNISVSAAICMHQFTNKMRVESENWGLTDDYKTYLKLNWIKNTIKAGDQLVAKFLAEKQ